MIRSVLRTLRVGKEKFYVGADLEGNSYYERPPVEAIDVGNWRMAKRTIVYAGKSRHLSEYGFETLPGEFLADSISPTATAKQDRVAANKRLHRLTRQSSGAPGFAELDYSRPRSRNYKRMSNDNFRFKATYSGSRSPTRRRSSVRSSRR